jgi:hypothetical protein
MPPPPCDQLGHVVAGDLGQQFVLAQKVDEQGEPVLAADRARMVLPDLGEPTVGHVVEP